MNFFDLRNVMCLSGPREVLYDNTWVIELPSWWQDTLKLWDGNVVTNWNSNAFAFSALEGPRVDLPAVWEPFQVMSPALQAAIEELAPGSIQFLPLRIRSTVGDNIVPGYAIANYRHRLKALDHKRTTLFLGEGRFKTIDPLGNYAVETPVLDPKKCTEKVFKVRGCSRLHIFREDIVEEFERRGLTGLNFIKVES